STPSQTDLGMNIATETRPAADANAAIVEAAIERVRRATETARAAQLKQLQKTQKSAASADRRATARALAAQPDPQPYDQGEPGRIELNFEFDEPITIDAVTAEPLAESMESADYQYQEPVQADLYSRLPHWPEQEPRQGPVELNSDSVAEVDSLPAPVSVEAHPKSDPLDYLTAEVRKVDEALGREFSRNQPAGLVSRIITDAIDLVVIAASFSVFAGSLAAAGANLRDVSTIASLTGILILVSFFYLVTTHCLAGKTFGMMFTNTRLVDSGKLTAPSGRQLFRRVLGYYIAALPFAAGFLWILVDKKRRGWQDHLAETLLATDY
ncbi:MAG TPA: RDD family protein, partial [Blastocatellia bacterium]|nr:RDD family protein [Blastocatellia bacterium]